MKKYPMPYIITTARWGAVNITTQFTLIKPQKLITHHMANQNGPPAINYDAAVIQAKRIAQRCQKAHMSPPDNWADTGQHFTNSRGGIICEGRHGTLDAILNHQMVPQGAQCFNFNEHSLGVENEGNYMEAEMPLVQWNSLVQLYCWLIDWFDLQATDIEGHRDRIGTLCPGNWLYGQLPRLIKEVHDNLTKWRAQ